MIGTCRASRCATESARLSLRRQGTVAKFGYKGIEVAVLGTRHSPYREAGGSGRHAGVQQNGYLVKLGGKTILHLGDASVGLILSRVRYFPEE